MRRRMRSHNADEFGKSGVSASVIGLNAPIIGAASSILADGITERESGETPPPPPLSMRTIVVGLIGMFLVGAAGLTYFVFAGAFH